MLDVIGRDMELLPSLLSSLKTLDPGTLDQEYSVSVCFQCVGNRVKELHQYTKGTGRFHAVTLLNVNLEANTKFS